MAPDLTLRPCPQCGASGRPDHQYCAACGFPIGSLGNNEDKFIGKTLPGGYYILDLISVGGMGRVYRAEQAALGRTVAVKIIHPHLLSDENSALRFMTEARAASQLNHPNSVAVFDFGRTEDGQPYLVMEYLRGKDLALVAYEDGPLPFQRIVGVLRQVLTALAEAHDLGIVHRDLKPENIIVEPQRRGGDHVKVVDFGLAKVQAKSAAPSVTSPGIVCGTPDYMAPEQGRGEMIDGRSDLYAVGVILFQLLTGRVPFEAEGPTQTVMMHLSVPTPDPRQVAPERNIPAALVEVVFKAMEKDPSRRYQDASEFAEALKVALELSESRPSLAPPHAQQRSVSSRPLMTCPGCQLTVPASNFCLECGVRLPAAEPRSTPPGQPLLPLALLGREEDLAWLGDRRQEAARGVVGARLVGEPGAGKTRLAKEFLAQSQQQGAFTVLVTPDPYWAESAYHGLRSAVRGLLELDQELAGLEALTSRASVEARRGLEVLFSFDATPLHHTPAERRDVLTEALAFALATASQGGKTQVVLAIDDLHHADSATRQALIDVLADPPADARALIVATQAPGFESGWGAAHAARVLGGLPPPVVARALSGAGISRLRPPEDVTGRGVLPLYLEQLIRLSLEGGEDPPARLADLVSVRLDGLEPDARRTLQAVAVLGDTATVKDITTLLPRLLSAESALAALQRAGMVTRQSGTYATSHPLLREIILGSTPAAVRRELHQRALELSERQQAPLEARALHAFYAEDSFQALLLLENVARLAQARGDGAAEILALQRGLQLARLEISRGELDDPLRAMLIFGRKLGVALTGSGDYSDAEGVLREALDVADQSGSERARVLAALAEVAHGRQRSAEALSRLDQAIDLASRAGEAELAASFEQLRRSWE